MNLKQIAAKVGELGAMLAVVGVFGTYWINTEVERRMNELAVNPADAPVIVALETEVGNLSDGQARIEGKVDAFSDRFIAYLEREANR